MDDRAAFEAAVASAPDLVRVADAAARRGDSAAVKTLAAAMLHAAFVDPFAVIPVTDAFARGRLGVRLPDAGAAPPHDMAELPRAFWDEFWDHLEARRDGRIAPGDATASVAALGGTLPIERRALWEEAARAHPKTARAETRAMPPKLTLEELAKQPKGSLAADFHALIVGNGFDLEVLDRSGLETLPPALAYLNTRILQMHDVWHLVGGYHFTALHEVGVSAFQLAQFNHGYSAMFLGIAVAGLAGAPTVDAEPVLQTMAEAWVHGRMTPSFMAIAWEDEWHMPIASLRARHGIAPFAGSLPADLFEQARAA